MAHHGWLRDDDESETLLSRRFFSVRSDRVTTPAGTPIRYDWVDTPDMVRVAALTDNADIIMIEQQHYLPNRATLAIPTDPTTSPASTRIAHPSRMWQLPGGAVSPHETPAQAATRELTEETGAIPGNLTLLASVWPLPGLTPSATHLFIARDVHLGPANPESSEADLITLTVPLRRAVAAALDGTIGCAPSAQLVLAVAAHAKQ